MKNHRIKRLFHLLAAAAMAVAVGGCAAGGALPAASSGDAKGSSAAGSPGIGAAGTLLISVNPEIEVEYDGRGLVTAVRGVGDDGRKIVDGYDGFQGQECREVVGTLVQKIYEKGYFDVSVEGRPKNVVVKLEKGSQYPNDRFLDDIVERVRRTVDACGVGSAAMAVGADDLDDSGRIGLEKAKELALAQLGLTEADFTEREYELDDGVYELEFKAGGMEYEFEVDAYSGKVMKADLEHNDDWNDLDDDDDDNDDHDDD